jgi:hypothetical protein
MRETSCQQHGYFSFIAFHESLAQGEFLSGANFSNWEPFRCRMLSGFFPSHRKPKSSFNGWYRKSMTSKVKQLCGRQQHYPLEMRQNYGSNSSTLLRQYTKRLSNRSNPKIETCLHCHAAFKKRSPRTSLLHNSVGECEKNYWRQVRSN